MRSVNRQNKGHSFIPLYVAEYIFLNKVSIMKNITDRFLKYVSFDSQSDPTSDSTPSSKKQWEIAKYITEELKQIGLKDVSIDELGEPHITVQGGVGNNAEVTRLLEEYKVDAIGWGTPFLFVPEATLCDDQTRDLLIEAGEEDLYLS